MKHYLCCGLFLVRVYTVKLSLNPVFSTPLHEQHRKYHNISWYTKWYILESCMCVCMVPYPLSMFFCAVYLYYICYSIYKINYLKFWELVINDKSRCDQEVHWIVLICLMFYGYFDCNGFVSFPGHERKYFFAC